MIYRKEIFWVSISVNWDPLHAKRVVYLGCSASTRSSRRYPEHQQGPHLIRLFLTEDFRG